MVVGDFRKFDEMLIIKKFLTITHQKDHIFDGFHQYDTNHFHSFVYYKFMVKEFGIKSEDKITRFVPKLFIRSFMHGN
jgi:hypothetical protein